MVSNIQVNPQKSGSTMIVVLGMTFAATLAASSMIVYAGARARVAGRQLALEQAFYVAEAGAEHVAAQIANGVSVGSQVTGILGDGDYTVQVEVRNVGFDTEYDISSTGHVRGARRVVEIGGVQRVSWARYALWYAKENPASGLWMAPGEQFRGRVYSKPRLHFHNDKVASLGKVHFYDHVWSSAKDYEVYSGAQPIFDRGITLNSKVEDLASVKLNVLRQEAMAHGLVLSGPTTIEVSGNSMRITNAQEGWNRKVVTGLNEKLIYVADLVTTSKKGSRTTYTTNSVTISAPQGLNGQLTLVSEGDINIINHIRYKDNPQTTPDSQDALGLIANGNVWIGTAAPNNLDVYAHIICVHGGFGVTNYDQGVQRGTLTVYGGIVNEVRNAVGIVGRKGYLKNYIFDTRFEETPPPYYPKRDDLTWRYWNEGAPES